jgi:hypothetical protein
MTNPLSGDKNHTVILNDLPDDLAEKLFALAEERGVSPGELAQELISRHLGSHHDE